MATLHVTPASGGREPMAINKNQHFVPRCHLRPFTLGAAGLAINLINLDRKVLIPNAPVNNQCSKDLLPSISMLISSRNEATQKNNLS